MVRQLAPDDNGPGVPPGLERRIFLPFFSAREGGQGIGLTVVRQLVNGMGVRHVRPLEGGVAFVPSFQAGSALRAPLLGMVARARRSDDPGARCLGKPAGAGIH